MIEQKPSLREKLARFWRSFTPHAQGVIIGIGAASLVFGLSLLL